MFKGHNFEFNPKLNDGIASNICRQWLEDYGVEDLKVKAPALLIMGDSDYVLKFGGLDDYIRSGKVREFVPNLETIFVKDGNHFVQEQFPGKINNLILNFVGKHKDARPERERERERAGWTQQIYQCKTSEVEGN